MNYTHEQNRLIAELSATYGLEPEQIIFFPNDPEPIFDREATSKMIFRLTDAVGIEDDIATSPVPDSITMKFRISFADGTFAASTGVANINEQLDGKPMSFEQVKSLATGRASRGALRNKGISLLQLHNQAAHGLVACPPPPKKDERTRALASVHILGIEAGYIFDVPPQTSGSTGFRDDSAWRRMISARYGVDSAASLSIGQLNDLAAFLRSQIPAIAASQTA